MALSKITANSVITGGLGITQAPANGSISLGDPVIIKPDGTVSNISGKNGGNEFTINRLTFGSATNPSSGIELGAGNPSIATRGDNVFVSYYFAIGGLYYLRAGYIDPTDSSNVIWGAANATALSVTSTGTSGIYYNANSNSFVYMVATAGTLDCRPCDVTGITATTRGPATPSRAFFSGISSAMGHSVATNLINDSLPGHGGCFGYAFEPVANVAVIVYQIDSTQYPTASLLYANSANVWAGATATIESVASGSTKFVKTAACYSNSAGRIVVAYGTAGNTVNIAVATIGANTLSFGTPIRSTMNLQSGIGASLFTLVPDDRRGKILLMGDQKIEEYSISGTTLTAGPVQTNLLNAGFSANGECIVSGTWDASSNTILALNYARLSPNVQSVYTETIKYNYATSRYESYSTDKTDYTKKLKGSDDLNVQGPTYSYFQTNNQLAKVGNNTIAVVGSFQDVRSVVCPTDRGYSIFYSYRPNITNINSDGAYYGVSAGNYTNGQTATINYVGGGATLTTSGLMPGSAYYVDYAGKLTTYSSNTVTQVGVAKSSTQLIVK